MPYFQYWENRSCIHFFFLFKLFLDTFICSALVTFLYSGLFKWLWLCSIFTPRKFFTGKFWSNGRCLRFVKLVCKIDRKEQRNKYARARGRLDHSETDVLSRLSVEKQRVPRFTLVSHEFVGHSRRSLLVLAYFTSCPRFLFRKRCTVQDAKWWNYIPFWSSGTRRLCTFGHLKAFLVK